MSKKPRLYTRLTRATSSLASYRSLWMAADHLLVVSSSGYFEEYRRIQFRNIQGFFTIESSRRTSWFLAWLFIGLMAAIVASTNYATGQRPIVSLVFLGVAVIGMVWNHLMGPSCKVFVLTGVQTLQLPSLVRRRKAAKVLARIQPLIVNAQGELTANAPTAPKLVEPPPLP
jgi:hypothetical protein